MPTRDELRQAYEAFRIPVGSPWAEVKSRYKTLVKLLHPDKHESPQSKESAEAELKFYNESLDTLKRHFQSSEHDNSEDCLCQPVTPTSNLEISAPAEGPEPSRESKPSLPRGWKPSTAQLLCASLALLVVAAVCLLSFIEVPSSPTVDPVTVSETETNESSKKNMESEGQGETGPITRQAGGDMNRIKKLQGSIQVLRHQTIELNKEISTLKAELRMTRVSESLEKKLDEKQRQVDALRVESEEAKRELVGITDRLNRGSGNPTDMPPLVPEDLQR